MNAAAVPCPLCRQESATHCFSAHVRGRHQAHYYQCSICGLLFIHQPHWLDEAYQEAIALTDTGIVARNLNMSRLTATLIYTCFDRQGRFLDYGGGLGIFTRLMRDLGFDFYWHDEYAVNQLARGFEAGQAMQTFEGVTCFEVLEHLSNPAEVLERIFALSQNVVFSTELLPDPVPEPEQWWYYGLDHGQHICFYTVRTLQWIAQHHGLHYYNLGRMGLFTSKSLSRPLLQLMIKATPWGLYRWVAGRMETKIGDDAVMLQNHLSRQPRPNHERKSHEEQ